MQGCLKHLRLSMHTNCSTLLYHAALCCPILCWAVFAQVQEVHDHIMREGIAKFGGYEIMTEGDSFQVAFATCQQAMAFCVDIQQRLQEQAWPKDVVAMNACKPIIGEQDC